MKIVINIENKKDLNKFYKKLFLYRSFLYKFTTFESINNKYDINDIIHALNIKNKTKRSVYIYDTSCNLIDNYHICNNICGFKNNICAMHQKNKLEKINGCCGECIYQSKDGCITKNLTCKLFFCSEVKDKYKVYIFDDIKLLKCFTLRQQLIIKSDYFSLREDVLKDLKYNSIIISSIRMIYRIIKKKLIKN